MSLKLNKKSLHSGFTLLEILLVVGIISILAGIVIVAINPSKQLAQVRNTERKSDIKQIDSALTQYYIDHNRYPTSTPATLTEICNTGSTPYPPASGFCDNLVDLSILVPNYITAIPVDPQGSISFLDKIINTAYALTNGAGYKIMKNPANKIITVAAKAELSTFIAIGTTTASTNIPDVPLDACVYDDPAWSECADSSKTRTLTATNQPCSGDTTQVENQSCTMPDITAPTVTAFVISSTAASLTINISSFTATDDVGVTGYKLTESGTAPLAGDAGWTGSAPTTYTFSTEGSKTLYAWAKDSAGNVSTSLNDSVVITLPCVATGGDVIDTTSAPGYKIHKFTTVGSANFTVTSGCTNVQVLVVAGGGGGGFSVGGGGGAGGYLSNNSYTVSAQTYTVIVGDGGAGGTSGSVKGSNGADSVFGAITAAGGGGGGSEANANGVNGGSGGGSASKSGGSPGIKGTGSQGSDGGIDYGGSTVNKGGGGGGGAGGVGGNGGSKIGGAGGVGLSNSITGSAVYYAGGGGGGFGTGAGSGGAGGNGGGGSAVAWPSVGGAGTPNTGGGGAGGGQQDGGSYSGAVGGKGGSGIVIVRYAI